MKEKKQWNSIRNEGHRCNRKIRFSQATLANVNETTCVLYSVIQYKHKLFIKLLIHRMQNNIVKKSMEKIWLDWKILLWQKGCQQLWQTGRISV